jgi:hypothetical protein
LARRPRTTSWAISTIVLLGYCILAPPRAFLYDAGYYSYAKDLFGSPLTFLDFRDELRGYALPWLLRVLSDLLSPFTSSPTVVARALTLILVPLLLCVVVPGIARRISPAARITVPRLLVLNALFFLAWYQDLLQPLSDIPALFFMAVGVLLLLRSTTVLSAAGAGACFGVAFNIRPSYLLALVALVVTLFLIERDRRRLLFRTAAVLALLLAVLVPQLAINLEHFDQASLTPIGATGLTKLQLKQGLQMDRYDTYAGPGGDYPRGMRFDSGAVNIQVTREAPRAPGDDLGVAFASIGDYVVFVAKHPVDVGALYARHVLNGLDTRFGGTYVYDDDSPNLVGPLVNFIVLAIAGVSLALRWMRRDRTVWRGPTTWLLLGVVAACIPGIVGAVETRFLMPIHLSLIAAFALCASPADLPEPGRRRTLAYGTVAVLVVGALAISADTMSKLEPEPMLVDGSVVDDPLIEAE